MTYRLLADFVLILHFAFVLFVVFGALLVLRYPRLMGLHLSALLWGVVVEWADWTCPLTPLENYFRLLGGVNAYANGFVEHFVSKMLYPEMLTLELRYMLGLALIVVNAGIYSYVVLMKQR